MSGTIGRVRLGLAAAVAVAIFASLASATTARAEPPFFQEPLVFQAETEPLTPTPDCQELPVSLIEGSGPEWGFASGTAFACPLRTISIPFAQFMSMVLILDLRGGTIEATLGASLFYDGTGPPRFPAGDFCVRGVNFGLPGELSTIALSCQGPITQATGVFRGRTGWVTYSYLVRLEAVNTPLFWSQLPTITITFS